jgi:hypothetical protein
MDYIQIIGYVAMLIAICSFQFKTQKAIVSLQFFSTLLFTVHFFLLKAYSGALLNAICMVRAAIFAQRHKKAWAAYSIWIWLFILLSISAYFVTAFLIIPTLSIPDYRINVLPFTNSDYFLVEIIPVIGNVITTFAVSMKDAKNVRKLTLISSPLWLTYNIICGSIGGAVTEIFCSISIIIGMLRLDVKRK